MGVYGDGLGGKRIGVFESASIRSQAQETSAEILLLTSLALKLLAPMLHCRVSGRKFFFGTSSGSISSCMALSPIDPVAQDPGS